MKITADLPSPSVSRCTNRSRVFIWSRAPYSIYTEQGTLILSRAFGVRHPAKRCRAIRGRSTSYTNQGNRSRIAGYTGQSIRSRVNAQYAGILSLFEVGHLRQLCLILDSGEKLKHVFLFFLFFKKKILQARKTLIQESSTVNLYLSQKSINLCPITCILFCYKYKILLLFAQLCSRWPFLQFIVCCVK